MGDSSLTLVEDGTTALNFLKETIKSSLNDAKDAFFVADLDDVARKHWRFIKGLPRVRPYYAVKCNNSPEILRTLAILGTGFDCASQAEINMILGTGIPAADIIYANTCKQASHIRHAAAHGVTRMTFDCESELEKVAENHPNAEMILRIKTDDAGSFSCLSRKFGAPLENCEHLLRVAKSLNVSVTGVSFHMGAGNDNLQGFHQAIGNARHLFDLGNQLGHKMRVLNIGGGFPGHPDFKPTFEEHSLKRIYTKMRAGLPTCLHTILAVGLNKFHLFAAVIVGSLEQYFPREEEVEVIAEPGRYYVTSAFTIAVNITTKKEKWAEDSDGRNRRELSYYLNDGLFGSFLVCKMFDKEIRLKPIVEKDCLPSAESFPSTLWGPCCTDKDIVMEDVDLPELEVGDWIFFPNMGAYYVSIHTVFNGFLAPTLSCIISKSLWPLLEPQWHKLTNKV